jgi:hypothetical protein
LLPIHFSNGINKLFRFTKISTKPGAQVSLLL